MVHQVQRVGWSGPVLIDQLDEIMQVVWEFLQEPHDVQFATLLIRKTSITKEDFETREEFKGNFTPPREYKLGKLDSPDMQKYREHMARECPTEFVEPPKEEA